MVHTPEFAGSSHPGLDLVGDEESAIAGAELAGPGEEVIRIEPALGIPMELLQEMLNRLEDTFKEIANG